RVHHLAVALQRDRVFTQGELTGGIAPLAVGTDAAAQAVGALDDDRVAGRHLSRNTARGRLRHCGAPGQAPRDHCAALRGARQTLDVHVYLPSEGSEWNGAARRGRAADASILAPVTRQHPAAGGGPPLRGPCMSAPRRPPAGPVFNPPPVSMPTSVPRTAP